MTTVDLRATSEPNCSAKYEKLTTAISEGYLYTSGVCTSAIYVLFLIAEIQDLFS